MKGILPFNLVGEGSIAAATAEASTVEHNNSILWNTTTTNNNKKKRKAGVEPRSVLEQSRSPSPPTSSLTFSSSHGNEVAAVSNNSVQRCGEIWQLGMEELEMILHGSEPQLPAGFDATGGFGLVDSFLGFEPIGGIHEPSAAGFPLLNANAYNNCGGDASNPVFPPLPATIYEDPVEEKPHLLCSNQFVPQQHNPCLLFPGNLEQEQQHHMFQCPPSFDSGNPQQSVHDPQQQAQFQALVEQQLLKAAELVEAGNFADARGILARLNLLLSSAGKPLLRSAFYFKEALRFASNDHPTAPNAFLLFPDCFNPATKLDVLLKLSAYKDFADISPILQFTNFTSIQAILEEVNGCDRIHIVDFDFGVGGQWSSFMQELSQRCGSPVAPTSLRITAFVSPSSHHPFELSLAQENLSHFAANLNISFELNILGIDSFHPSLIRNMSPGGGNEAIAVNIPVGLSYVSIPALLRLVNQLSPNIVVSVDNGCDRSDLSFSQHFIHALHSSAVLLESIDASGIDVEVTNKIERFLVKPRITSTVLGRLRGGGKLVPWRTLFALAGFIPIPFSNFTEIQADCLLKKVQMRGFHVEKRQSSLLLFWQSGELASVSAWRC